MTFNASVVAHSKSPDGLKVCTFEVTYPRAIHCSMIAHCLSSRMSLSVRATSSSIVLTGTEFDDFYALLDNSDAEEGLSTIVRLMREAHKKKMPKELKYGEIGTCHTSIGMSSKPLLMAFWPLRREREQRISSIR